jgi:hypothetical protein
MNLTGKWEIARQNPKVVKIFHPTMENGIGNKASAPWQTFSEQK